MAKKKKKVKDEFEGYIQTPLQEINPQTQGSIDYGTQESGKFTGATRRISISSDSNIKVVGVAKQQRTSVVSVVSSLTNSTFTFTNFTNSRFLLKKAKISIYDADNSLVGLRINLREGTITGNIIMSYFFTGSNSNIDFDFDPPPTFDRQMTVEFTSLAGLPTPVFNGSDFISWHGYGYEEEM